MLLPIFNLLLGFQENYFYGIRAFADKNFLLMYKLK